MRRYDLHWNAIVLISLVSCTGCALQTSGTAEDVPVASGDDAGDETARVGDGASDTSVFDAALVDTGVVGVDTSIDTGVADDTAPTDSLVIDTARDTLLVDTGPEVPICNESACGALPSPAKRLGLVDPGIACPPGYTSSDVVEELAGAGCGCGCTLEAPTCPGTGTVDTGYGASSTCGSTGVTLTPTGSGVCSALGFTANLNSYFSGSPPGATGGACTSTPVTTKSAVSRPRRLCEPGPSSCAADVCASPFTECIEAASACPAAYPNARTIGSDVSVACPACSCALTRGTCSGSADFFSAAGCTGRKTTLAIDDTCVAVPAGAGAVTSFEYTPSAATGASCGPSFTTAPGTRTVVAARNLCCR